MRYNLFLLVVSVLLLGAGCLPASNQSNSEPAGTDATPEVKSTTENSLNLSGRELTKVPEDLFNQTNLVELDLSNNKLTGAIPAEIRKLKNLKVLNLSNNEMTGLPAEIGQLQYLEVLDVSYNKLTGLPYELANLKNLITLNISGNNYSEADLKKIQEGLSVGVRIVK